MKRRLCLKIVVVWVLGLTSCNKDNPTNYNITKNSVGEFKLFDSMKDFEGKKSVLEMKIDELTTIGYVENNDTLYYVSKISSTNRIHEIIVKSNKMKLPNGIHIDMSVNSIGVYYPEIRNSMRTLKIPNLGIDLFVGNYWPKEFIDRSNPMKMKGISFVFEEIENELKKDTILKVISLKENLYH